MLQSAVVQAGFTQHVCVVALLELIEQGSVILAKDHATSLYLRKGKIIPREAVLAILQRQLFAEQDEIPFKRYQYELRRLLWRGRAALLKDAECANIFLPDPGKQKRKLMGCLLATVLPWWMASLVLMQTEAVLGVLGIATTLLFGGTALRRIATIPERLTAEGEVLRAEVLHAALRKDFWNILIQGNVPAESVSPPPHIQETMKELNISFLKLYAQMHAALTREYRGSPVGR